MSVEDMATEVPKTEGDVVINDQMVHLARNAMLVAGMEMGKEGDHWPVIKANIHAMMRDYENLKIEIAVQEQLKEHLGKMIGEYESLLERSDEAFRAAMRPHVQQMREVYDAMFAPAVSNVRNYDILTEEEEGRYVSWKSSAAIIRSLMEDQNEQ